MWVQVGVDPFNSGAGVTAVHVEAGVHRESGARRGGHGVKVRSELGVISRRDKPRMVCVCRANPR